MYRIIKYNQQELLSIKIEHDELPLIYKFH